MLRLFSYIFSAIALVFTCVLIARLIYDGGMYLVHGEFWRHEYWDYSTEKFNALTMLLGTVTVSIVALVFSVPIGIGAAIYTSEYSRGLMRASTKIILELLSGVPSVVYGLLGVVILMPLLQSTISKLGGQSAGTVITAGILLAVMVLPTIITFSDDALRCVPRTYREEGSALGLSKSQVIWSIVLPNARKGLAGATMLAWGRAIGETIAVFLVIGRSDRPFSMTDTFFDYLIQPGQTLTSKLGGTELSLAYGDSNHWSAMMGLGLLLWLLVGSIAFLSENS